MTTLTSSSASSSVFFAFALLTISLLILLLLRHYLPLRSTPAYLLIPVFLALVLPASIILLVPIDLASNAVSEDRTPRGIWLPDKVMLAVWRIAYWLTFVLTWFVLPLLGDYVDSGHRDPRARFNYSLRINLRYQLIIFTAGAIGLVYFFLQAGVHITNLKATVMALAYAWGLVLAIYLMGHGLVDIPRRLFKSASTAGRLRQLQSHAPGVHERMTEAVDDLNQLEQQVLQLKRRKTGTARDFQDWIDELAESSDLPESRTAAHSAAQGSADDIAASAVPAVITDRYLADLTRKLKRARHRRVRFIEEWDRLVRDALDAQAILDSTVSKRLVFPSSSVNTTPNPAPMTRRNLVPRLLTPTTRYLIHVRLLPTLRLLAAALLSLASLTLIWSELTHSISPRLSLISLTLLHHPSPSPENLKLGIPSQLLAAAWLLYMSTAALSSIRIVRVWGNRALVRRHTYPESATWYAMQVAKLTVPLSYNFITLLPREVYEETAFYRFLGRQIDLTSVGMGFSGWFPMFVAVPVLATLFGLYGRVKQIAGFGVFEDADDAVEREGGGMSRFEARGWREGKALIERERLSFAPGGPGGGSGGGSRAADASNTQATLGLTTRDPSPQPQSIRPYTDADFDTDPEIPSSTASWAELPSSMHNPSTSSSTLNSTTNTAQRVQGAYQPQGSDRVRGVDRAHRQPPPPQRYTDSDPSEGGFLSDFAHRVRNTLDTVDKPDFSLPKFERPKWMRGGESRNGDGGGSRGGGAGERVGRLFGRRDLGRDGEGRVRL
ncbi:MAG: hypothetical protein M1828_001908 [Chrysothrix sp. TS-e1954]|nr:MAG: hypothetical protein M1828_001908 [Chrysothrix sp. TS-e1954]